MILQIIWLANGVPEYG